MSAKSVLVFCVHALFVQTIIGACWGNSFNSRLNSRGVEGLGWAGDGLVAETPLSGAPCAAGAPLLGAGRTGFGPTGIVASNGGGLAVSSASPTPPAGVSVASENSIEGVLAVGGELPFLGTVGLEGALPTAGLGTVSYGCGNNAVGIVAEDVAPIAAGVPVSAAGLGYGLSRSGGLGWAGRGIGSFGCRCNPL